MDEVGDLSEIDKISGLEGIEKADAYIILLAQEGKEILISNDYVLIKAGLNKGRFKIRQWCLCDNIGND